MLEYLTYRKWAIDATLFQHCFNVVALYVNYLGQYMNTELLTVHTNNASQFMSAATSNILPVIALAVIN